MTRSFLFLLASTRAEGNTARLARLAAEQLPADVEQRWLDLDQFRMTHFADIRHDGDGVYPEPTGNDLTLLDATLAATDLVICSPLYWYSLSTSARLYFDHWSGWMRVPGRDFRPRMAGRTMWGVTAYTSPSPAAADPLVGQLRSTAEYMKMNWGGVLLGYGNRPGDVLDDEASVERAKNFF